MAAPPTVFTEGFNSDYSSQWDGSANQNNGAFGNVAPGITNSGTAGFEGDGFALMEVARSNDLSATTFNYNVADIEVVEVAGVTYTFSGDFGWRNGPTNAAADIYLNNSWTGFAAAGSRSTTEGSLEFVSIPSNTLQTYSFSYTTTPADVGEMLTLYVSFVDRDLVADSVELLADNWQVTKAVFFEGFNSDFVSQWDGTVGQNNNAWGNLTPGATTGGGTVQTEGDGFAALTVSTNTPTAENFNGDSIADLGTVTSAGITYTFSGDFSWRNGDTNTLSQVNIKNNTTGFKSGATGELKSSLMSGNWTFDNAVSNEFTTVTFSYTTTEDDVGHPISLQVRTHRLANGFVGSVELLADNWLVTAEIDTVVPFAAVPFQYGDNLIPNGDFLQNTTNAPAPSTHPVYNITGSLGDFRRFDGGTVDVAGWTPFYDDPNGLATNIGTAGVDDSGLVPAPVLDGTYYLDTHLNAETGKLSLNSAMDYRNGLIQSNALSAASIDSNKTYQFVVDGNHPTGTDTDSGVLTAKLTDGSGTPIAGATLTDVTTSWTGTRIAEVGGADLIAAGQVNVSLDHICTNQIPGFPDSMDPADITNGTIVAQAHVYSVSLYEPITPANGDVNHDGVVDEADVAFSQSHLDGSIDGGLTAASRVANLMVQGMMEAEALEYLNLTEFDYNGDGTFDAQDVSDLEGDLYSIPVLSMVSEGTNLTFVWNSNEGLLYDLVATNDLVAGGAVSSWPVYRGYEGIAADASRTNALVDVPVSDGHMFFALIEEAYVPPQTNYLTVADKGFDNPIENTNNATWNYMNAVWNDDADNTYEVSSNSPHGGNHKGHMFRINAIYQDVGSVAVGDTVSVSYWLEGAAAAGNLRCDFLVNGVSQGYLDVNKAASSDWTEHTHSVTVSASGTLRLHFSRTDAIRCYIDDISDVVVATPAP